jgi:hypothetical protein
VKENDCFSSYLFNTPLYFGYEKIILNIYLIKYILALYRVLQSYLYNVIFCFRQGVILIGNKSEITEVQKHVEDCINWLNVYFGDVGSITSVHMPDICVATEMGMLLY